MGAAFVRVCGRHWIGVYRVPNTHVLMQIHIQLAAQLMVHMSSAHL